MARKNKYTSALEVVAELGKSDNIDKSLRNIREVIRRAGSKGEADYADMVEAGVDMFNKFRLEQDLKDIGFIDPEDVLNEEEFNNKVGM
ncbi:hypothetical protein VPHG_00055 [Vibrio phage 11895-B1]|uniref:hypothetical protein n=1 Tax=Vibrio phage 11895-B1 TaxID=754075 RepID=UPI0002C08A36|nr:hypothetical protein VPHG_00055 [Vibrio phage 11895-B1]AGH32122.1 hypothetical protein VPHG_00055 [Vibrio phage 11895-B1]